MADNTIDEEEPEGSEDSMDLPEALQEPAASQKRKGGRKPIYATSEERKQRNRQAQAAFRERRTEYIKQLEETVRVHEVNLRNLHTARQSAADECTMLRYKNSLLERMLLEKGIDVQAELAAKTNSAKVGLTPIPQSMSRRKRIGCSHSRIVPKIEADASSASLQSYPTPTFLVGIPSTPLEKHYKQLEEEYNTQDDMVDDENVVQSGPGPYPGNLYLSPQPQIHISQDIPLDSDIQVQQLDGGSNVQSFMTQLFDPTDPTLDTDPFGPSASMKFPT